MAQAVEYRFSEFLRIENIVYPLQARAWQEAVVELARLLSTNADGFDCDAVIEACIEREMASSTVLAPGLALPHARVEDLDQVLVAVGFSPQGIPFSSDARGEVSVVILILTPKSNPGLYLQVLAALTREVGAPGAMDKLLAAASAQDVYHFFREKDVALPPYLKARNLMEPHPVTLLESDSLKTAIDRFCTHHAHDIPVVDEERDLRGVVALETLLRLSLPQHLLWMHDLSPILLFEPFSDMLRRDEESRVADFMEDNYVSVNGDVPAIQLAKVFLTEQVRQILVLDGRKLIGVVDIASFVAKVLWA